MPISSVNYSASEEQAKIKKLNWYEWPRYSRKIFTNELASLDAQQLADLENDVRTTIVSCASHIEELTFAIRACTELQWMHRTTMMKEKNRAISSKLKAEKFLLSVREEVLSRHGNDSNKNLTVATLKITASDPSDTHTILDRACKSFRNRAFFGLLRAKLGDNAVEALDRKADTMIAGSFLHWAETSDHVTREQAARYYESMIEGSNKALRKKGYNTMQDFISVHLPVVEPTELW